MKIYFDESGNTGCVLTKDNLLNFRKQSLFALCGVIIRNELEEIKLVDEYVKFKKKFNIKGEIKGTDLFKKENNELLDYFIDNILDTVHFEFCLYDKKFYLATLLLCSILGEKYRDEFPLDFYHIASSLSFEADDFFVFYCEMIKDITKESLHSYLEFLINYDYKHTSKIDNPLILMVREIIDSSTEEHFVSDFLTYGWYENEKQTNVINLNALGELLYTIKTENDLLNKEMVLIHDNTDEFKQTILSELNEYSITVNFINSKSCEMIQVADNAVSTLFKVFSEMVKCFQNKTEWQEDSEWILSIASRVFNKVSLNSIKFTVPIQNWAVAICVNEMFLPRFPKSKRNNLFFNMNYMKAMNNIAENICDVNFDYKIIEENLRK